MGESGDQTHSLGTCRACGQPVVDADSVNGYHRDCALERPPTLADRTRARFRRIAHWANNYGWGQS